MSIVRNFNLYLNAGICAAPYINVSQYDQGEQWVFTLYKEDGTKYLPSTGAIIGIKADNRGIINTGTVDADGRVVINETQQMTAAAGIAIFELLIDGDTHGTANFLVNVEQRPGDNADLSDSDLSLIQEAVDSAAVIVEVIGDGDPSEVIGEHVDAWLDAHPEATTTVQDGAITAPKLNNSLWDKLLVSEEASGNPASFDDGADDVPVSSLKVNLEPIQTGSGDPSPTNIRPISGHSSVTVKRTGKNLANVPNATTTQANVTFTVSDGIVTTSGTAGATNYIVIGTAHLKGGVEYAITGCPSGGGSGKYGISIRDGSSHLANDYGSGATYTPSADISVNVCIRYWYNFNLSALTFKPMIRLASDTDSTFAPYNGTSYPYSLGQTVYGGSVDLATGVLTVTWASRTINGSENWALENADASHKKYWITDSTIAEASNYKTSAYIICDKLPTAINSYDYTTDYMAITAWAGQTPTNYLYIMVNTDNTDIADATALKTWLASNPLQVVYKLATPTTVQLTPTQVNTLLGYNNISSSGTVDVIYHADTKLYVDKMTAVDNNIIAPTEEGFTATRNYTVNDLVIVNDTLYKVTANIASGSTITPNSNVTQTTLSALIKALS